MSQIHNNLLAKLKRANIVRKAKLALQNGFDTVEAFKEYLEAHLEPVLKSNKPTIHMVQLVDSSGSMFNYNQASKFGHASEAILKEIAELKTDDTADYLVSLYEFSNASKCHFKTRPVSKVRNIRWKEYKSMTRLTDTIHDVLKDLIDNNDTSIKVLVKVFTDGQDNRSSRRPRDIATMIKNLPENITFTFVAAETDQAYIGQYETEVSNTLFHDNTSEGVEIAFGQTRCATVAYSANVVAGKPVRKNFYYKNITKK